MNFDIVTSRYAKASSTTCLREHPQDYPMQAYKIMHGLWGMGQMMFTKYLVVRTTT